jgi:hypothetical protein
VKSNYPDANEQLYCSQDSVSEVFALAQQGATVDCPMVRGDRRRRSVPLYDLKDGIFADPQFADDQTIAPARSDKCEHFRSEPIGFRPLLGLAAEALVSRFCSGDTEADAFLNLSGISTCETEGAG